MVRDERREKRGRQELARDDGAGSGPGGCDEHGVDDVRERGGRGSGSHPHCSGSDVEA